MATPNYDIDYTDARFKQVESDKTVALSELEKTYGSIIDNADQYYQKQIDASKQWEATQKENQQAQTDFAIEQIEQNKVEAKKDYTKEQSGAYVDWQKQSNQYGVNAEQMAAQGLANTGYSESSQISMYNTYQNRVATARESYNLAVQSYNNSITEARLQNNSMLAEIAYKALQQQLELSLQGFQYKNTLLLEKANRKTELENTYYNRYLSVLDQINKENALAEEVRQYNESLALQKEQAEANRKYQEEQLALARKELAREKEQESNIFENVDDDVIVKRDEINGTTTNEKVQNWFTNANNKYNNQGFTGKTYEEAMAYLKKNGLGSYNLLTKNEWLRRKSSGSNGAATAYSSYSDYLTYTVQYALAQK